MNDRKKPQDLKRKFEQSLDESRLAGTTVTLSDIKQADMTKLLDFNAECQKMMARSFVGLPIRVDPNLIGNRYYLNVSQELFDAIKKESAGGGS